MLFFCRFLSYYGVSMNNIDKFFSKLLLIVIPLYFTQGAFFPSGGIISQALMLIWLLIGLYYVKEYLKSKDGKSILGNAILVFWIANIVYWYFSPRIVSNTGLSFTTFGDLKNLTVVMLTFFPFAILSKRGYISVKRLKKFLFLLLGAAIIAFFVKRNDIQNLYDLEITNNTAYYFVVVLPFIGCYFNKKFSFVFFAIIFVFLMLCGKRGAILCAVISTIVFAIQYLAVNKRIKFSRIVSILILILIIIYISNTIFETSELLQRKFEATREGDSSARDFYYSALWKIFQESPLITQLFGHGMSQTVALVGGYAHNDWLELLTNNGILGVIMYAIIFITSSLIYLRSRSMWDNAMSYIYLSSLLCFFARSIFSMGYLAPESALFVAGLATYYRKR